MTISEQKQKEILEEAMFRLGLISPVVQNTYSDKSEQAYFNRISSKPIKGFGGTIRFIKPSTLKTWKQMYQKEGFDGLKPKIRSDIGSSRRIDADLANDIQRLRKEFPDMPATSIHQKLVAEGFIDAKEMSYCTLQRFFKNNPIEHSNENGIKDRKAFEAEFVNGIWQADTLYGPYVGEPAKQTFMQAIIDDKSRKIVNARFYLRDTAANFQSTLKEAIISHGLPYKLFVDNGGPYKNDQLTMICGNLGIVLCHAAVRDGAAKGKIERFNRTLRLKFLSNITDKEKRSLQDLNVALNHWIAEYNTTVHSSLKTTPTDAYNSGVDDINWFNGDSKMLDDIFLNRIFRKVANDATIAVEKRKYDVPMEYIGKRIEVRYIPDEIENIWLVKENGELQHLVPTDKVENSKLKRKKPAYRMDYNQGGNHNV